MNYLQLIGKSEAEAISYCQSLGITYQMIITRDPKVSDVSQSEMKVIRLRQNQEVLEILLGCFAPATYYIPQQ